jgi:hypothetical protein
MGVELLVAEGSTPEERLRDAPAGMRIVADWFDVRDDARGYKGKREVQRDLRRWAEAIEELYE